MAHGYDTPQSFDRALKKAIAKAGGDRGERYRQMLRDRFLCRVFSDPDSDLVLKGGSGLLARIPDARSTRDIDFGRKKSTDADQVLKRLNAAASRDLGDWCRFKLTKCEESLDENGYSRLLKLRYSTLVGEEEKDPILIDLSLDCTTTLPPEHIAPMNRVEIDGVEVCDYLVYPLPDQLADKFCAIMELQPGGYPSSRMKDLVDVVTYVLHEPFIYGQLRRAILSECAKRGMSLPERFEAPQALRERFDGFASKCGTPREFACFEGASGLASRFFDPVLSGEGVDSDAWSSERLQWMRR